MSISLFSVGTQVFSVGIQVFYVGIQVFSVGTQDFTHVVPTVVCVGMNVLGLEFGDMFMMC